jgi:hypothetical protein
MKSDAAFSYLLPCAIFFFIAFPLIMRWAAYYDLQFLGFISVILLSPVPRCLYSICCTSKTNQVVNSRLWHANRVDVDCDIRWLRND